MKENLIHINDSFGWFLGTFDNNHKHQHYALQLSIPISGPICIETTRQNIQTNHPVLLKSNLRHKITSENPHLLILLNPVSTIGHAWSRIANHEIEEFQNGPASEIQTFLVQNGSSLNPTILKAEIDQAIKSFDCSCHYPLHEADQRINQALKYLENDSQRIVPAEETANHCNLSTSRFLHLFREQTGLTYRRAQLWTKLLKALPLLKAFNLTETAHEAGFADSAHFSRTFRENFGFSPHELLKLSQFVQV
jgi:AraC-like DNA-binding protein